MGIRTGEQIIQLAHGVLYWYLNFKVLFCHYSILKMFNVIFLASSYVSYLYFYMYMNVFHAYIVSCKDSYKNMFFVVLFLKFLLS